MNPSITKLLIGKTESEAILILQKFNQPWRIAFLDGQRPPSFTTDRNDKRYGLVISNGLVERIIFG